MKIKTRLSLYFTAISSAILLFVMVLVYFSFYKSLQIDFFNRLTDRINIARRLYIEADEQSRADLTRIREKYQEKISGEVIRIYDAGNDAAFIPDDKQYWPDNIINEVRKNGDIEYSEKGRHVVGIHYKDEHGDFVILASAQDPGRISRLNQFMTMMIMVFVLSVVVVFVGGRWFAEKALSPINKLVVQLQKINANNLDTRVRTEYEKDEIGLLATNFNKLLEKLERAFEVQRAFVANASHELRTPITSIIGEAEVSLKQERDAAEYKTILHSILAESVKLNDTISSLIDLAQVDFNFSRASHVPIRADDLVWELQEYWSQRLFPNALIVRMDDVPANESTLIINANRALLTIALNNVISNAFKFSGNKPVTCLLEVSDEDLRIKIKDSGVGIPENDTKQIFEPFYRSGNASSYSGSGIGLYVTAKIVALLKGNIKVISVPGSGTAFTLRFRHMIGESTAKSP